MAAITDLSDLINRSTGGNNGTPQNVFFYKAPRIGGVAATAPIAGRMASLWRYDGNPSGGATPTTVVAPTNATQGALPFTNAGGSRESWMTQAFAMGNAFGTYILYDRLLQIGGLSGIVTTAQTVGGTLTRNTTGTGNFAFVEINTQIGTTVSSVTMTYTDQSGNTGNVSTAVQLGGTGFRDATRAIMLSLAAGDTGIQAVDSITLSASTGTAGDIGVVVGKPIAYIVVGQSGAAGWRDFVTGLPSIPKIEASSCLSLLFMSGGTTAPETLGGYSIVEA